jgi:chromosome partitioning protein
MKTVAVISQKGGSGKSTLSIHLATEAARAGGKALLIDLDPQGNAVRWAARRGEELPPDVSAESPASIESVLINAVRDGYDIVFFDTAPNADRTALHAAPIRSRVVEEAREAITGRNATVCPVVIRERVALRHCMPDGRVAAELDAEGQAAKEITALYKNMMLCLNVGISAKRHLKV